MPAPPDDGTDPETRAKPVTAPPSAASVTYLNYRSARAATWLGVGDAIFLALGALADSAILLGIGAAEAALTFFLLVARQSLQHRYLPDDRSTR